MTGREIWWPTGMMESAPRLPAEPEPRPEPDPEPEPEPEPMAEPK